MVLHCERNSSVLNRSSRINLVALKLMRHREQFEGAGYRVVPFGEVADVTVVNTCTVTSQGDAQSRQMLRRAHRASPDGVVVATGCYAQTDPDVIAEMPEVDLVVGTAEKKGSDLPCEVVTGL